MNKRIPALTLAGIICMVAPTLPAQQTQEPTKTTAKPAPSTSQGQPTPKKGGKKGKKSSGGTTTPQPK